MQDPPTDPTGLQFRGAFSNSPADTPAPHEIMPSTPNPGMMSGGSPAMAPEHASQPTRPPAWPENPPAWPEMPPPPPPPSASVFDPLPYGGRSAANQTTQRGAQDPARTSFPPPPSPVPSPFAPQPTGPQQYTPQPTGPHQHAPQPTGPQHYTPRPTGPQQPQGPQYGPHTGPQPSGAQPSRPQPHAPSPTGPQRYDAGPRPHDTGPQPRGTGPQQYPPPVTGPVQFPQQGAAPGQYAPEAPAQPRRLPDDAPPAPSYGPVAPATGPSGQSGPPGASYTPPGQAAQSYIPLGTESTMRVPGPGARAPERPLAPEQQHPAGPDPSRGDGADQLRGKRHAPSQDPADPYKPFVTAGQISGPKTPPPERQQELWNTVFGENYQAIDEPDDDTGGGRRVWLLALIASVAVAMVAALLWAFLAGPLRSTPADTGASESGDGTKTSSSGAAKPSTDTPRTQSIGKLPKYSGAASPRTGVLTDAVSAITVARLGGPWRLDLRSQHVRATYGFESRQYVAAGNDTAGKPRFAQVMTGPLAEELAGKYSADKPGDLTPVISSVAFAARNKFFPAGNKVVKTAEQRLSAGGRPARVVAYQILAGSDKTTLVVGAVSTGAKLPVIVYMAVPDSKKALLPDVNTIFSSIRPTQTAG